MYGRETELAELGASLSAGRSPIVVEGPPGIGKSTILNAVRRQFTGEVVACRPGSAETSLSFSALVDVLTPIAEESSAALTPAQRVAFDAVMGGEDSDAVEVGLVSAAARALLGAAAAEGPLLIVLDDAQWLDPMSDLVLGYCMRRIDDPALSVLIARRSMRAQTADRAVAVLEAIDAREPLVIRVGPLADPARRAVVDDAFGSRVDASTFQRIDRAAGGNPLHLIELARWLRSSRLGDVEANDLAALVASRVAAMPAPTRQFLLEMAAAGSARSNEHRPLLEPAVIERIVVVADGQVRFVHPLHAEAVYRSATGMERRAAHRRLASVAPTVEERAHHLALSVDGPDAAVAGELDRAVASIAARGGAAEAADLATRALELTPETEIEDRRRRQLTVATMRHQLGDIATAGSLLDEVTGTQPGTAVQSRSLCLLGEIRSQEGRAEEAIALGHAAIDSADGLDELVPAMFLLAHMHFSIGQLDACRVHLDQALDLLGDDPCSGLRAEAMVVRAAADAFEGNRVDWPALDEAVANEIRDRRQSIFLRPSIVRSEQLLYAGRVDESRAALREYVAWGDERGDDTDMVMPRLLLASGELMAGCTAAALAECERAVAVTELSGLDVMWAMARAHHARILATAGHLDRAEQELERARPAVEAAQWIGATGVWALAGATIALVHGDGERTAQICHHVVDMSDDGVVQWPHDAYFLADLVDATTAGGPVEGIDRLVAVVRRRDAWTDVDWVDAVVARADAVIEMTEGRPTAAIDAAVRAVALARSSSLSPEVGRSLLLLGVLQRRMRRRGEARRSFDEARSIFGDAGASGWVQRCDAELDRLTPLAADKPVSGRELEAARLAAAGLTNQEIAGRMFVSRRTVEATLRRVYGKLGVTSRARLGLALQAFDDDLVD